MKLNKSEPLYKDSFYFNSENPSFFFINSSSKINKFNMCVFFNYADNEMINTYVYEMVTSVIKVENEE